jgi:predicted ferric reductase
VTALATAKPAASWAPPLPLDRDATVDRRVRLGSAVTLWVGLLLITYWWVADGGVTDLAHWDSGLTSLGRVAGLWAANLLLVQVLLMSRLPPLEHAYGRDRLARMHRLIGFLSFSLMITHIVLIIGGYAAGQWSAVLSTIWQLITGYGGMLLAVAGTVCLIMVVVTSVKAARRRLRYESWHLLHLYGYLGVALALPHQLWTGQDFLLSPAATLYWWTLWAAAAAAIVVWRFGLPLWRSARYGLRVAGVARESSDVVSVYLTGRRLERLPLRAGQFMNVRFLSRPGWTRANPFSLSVAPRATPCGSP